MGTACNLSGNVKVHDLFLWGKAVKVAHEMYISAMLIFAVS